MSDTVLTEDEKIEAACDWSDFRKEYAQGDLRLLDIQHKAFLAGWRAGRHGEQSSVLR